ncbi:tyrosine-type recombinase/integrase [Agarivorans sp. B2Z047]|uniref:integrase arm-type DNA-binding domain-containing protein n=1 Tax=Agarivorans sp. B2Z047 TaxID=2652721 RepID=UPI00128B9B66|nr:integrase arm-type DNA-binding domain-containing protein [Agarivorans sp. B2Z047]MPW31828.1 tyrosine-type recombinase/integrase [Agarivorans sp. B2Z047]UQN41933.1 tyrosine-type recombinase/integrase [Agarivorans sp. B2Z047]
MAKQVKPLTESQIKNAKGKEKEYILSDGYGLRLRIKPTGTKTWLLNYTHPILGKRVNLTLGTYPYTTLKLARDKRFEANELLAQGIDPKQYRDEQQAQQKLVLINTLEKVALEWIKLKQNRVSADHIKTIERSLALHVFPSIGDIPITDITPQLVIQTLKPLEHKGSLEVLRRLCQRLNEVMKFACNHGWVKFNCLTDIKDVFLRPKVENMKTLRPEALPELMKALSRAQIQFTTRCLIEWQLHTMVRPGEAAGTCWDEIDWGKALWVIPAPRMKKKRSHSVPLTPQTLSLLHEMKKITGHGVSEFVFASYKDASRHCCSETANMAIKRMGFKGRLVSHGLRALASTTLNEQGTFNGDLVEAALAHGERNKVRAAYNRSQYIEQRRPMMRWWSDHITAASHPTFQVRDKV